MGDGRSSGARRRTRAADCAVIDGELGALRPGGVAGIAMASLLIEAATPMLSQIFPLPPRSVWIGAYSHLPARSRWVRWFYSGTADLLRQSGNVTALCRPGLQRNCLFSGLRTASDADCGNRQACASRVQTIRSRLFSAHSEVRFSPTSASAAEIAMEFACHRHQRSSGHSLERYWRHEGSGWQGRSCLISRLRRGLISTRKHSTDPTANVIDGRMSIDQAIAERKANQLTGAVEIQLLHDPAPMRFYRIHAQLK
jgi:hypothetical protein